MAKVMQMQWIVRTFVCHVFENQKRTPNGLLDHLLSKCPRMQGMAGEVKIHIQYLGKVLHPPFLPPLAEGIIASPLTGDTEGEFLFLNSTSFFNAMPAVHSFSATGKVTEPFFLVSNTVRGRETFASFGSSYYTRKLTNLYRVWYNF